MNKKSPRPLILKMNLETYSRKIGFLNYITADFSSATLTWRDSEQNRQSAGGNSSN